MLKNSRIQAPILTMTIASCNGATDVTTLLDLIPVQLFAIWTRWAVHLLILSFILLWVEVNVLGGACVGWIWSPFAMWVNALGVFVVLVLDFIIQVLPEVTGTTMDRVPSWIPVKIAGSITFVVNGPT
jgi:hypothetical protein